MNLPWTIWLVLIVGGVWNALPPQWCVRWLERCLTLVVWIAIFFAAVPLWLHPAREVDMLARGSLIVALLWSAGFCGCVRSGDLWLTLGGIGATAVAQDFVTAALGWELVRRSTIRNSGGCGDSRSFPSLGLWIAIVAWLFATGSLEFRDIATVLQRSYAAAEPQISLGRPALVVIGAACLTILSAVAPCFAFLPENGPASNDDQAVAGLCARQIVSLTFLARCCGDVFIGIETPVSWVLLVLTAAAWVLAVRTVSQPSRLERFWTGCATWQLAISLTWLMLITVERTSTRGGLPESGGGSFLQLGLIAELFHTVLVLAGMTAAVRLLAHNVSHDPNGVIRDIGPPQSPLFLEDLRGIARERPFWSVLLLAPLASLMGLPLLLGGWLRFLLAVSFWALPHSGPNDTLAPHHALIVMQMTGVAAWILLAASALTVFRTVLWEHSLTAWSRRSDGWTWCVAVASAAALLFGVAAMRLIDASV